MIPGNSDAGALSVQALPLLTQSWVQWTLTVLSHEKPPVRTKLRLAVGAGARHLRSELRLMEIRWK